MTRTEIRPLTSFRFIAAFYVFIFHLDARRALFGEDALGSLVREGAVGMTMFFMLSGFILSYSYAAGRIEMRAYFLNRVSRIYPVYLLAALLALPWLLGDLADLRQSLPATYLLVTGVLMVVLGVFLLQAWIPYTFGFWNNSASWSISTEAFFYGLFPYLRQIPAVLSNRHFVLLFVALCVLSSTVPLAGAVFKHDNEGFVFYYALPAFRLAEFLCGILAYNLMSRIEMTDAVRVLLLSTIALAVGHIILLGDRVSPTMHNWIVIPAVGASLILLFHANGPSRSFWGSDLFVWLGKISYCFYSFQFHVLEGMRYLMPEGTVSPVIFAAACTVVLLAVSALAYHLFEEPVRKWIRSRSHQGGLPA